MVNSLLSDEAADAVKLLQSHFVGFLGKVSIKDSEKQKQADFLTAEGVLLKLQVTGDSYCMALAYINSFIQWHVIPQKFRNAPSRPIPMQFTSGPLDILGIFKESIKFFNKDLIHGAVFLSYKQSKVRVGGAIDTPVPWESVYDTELMRILTNWLTGMGNFTITGQPHFKTHHGEDKYPDILVSKLGYPTVVLELIATGDFKTIKHHITKMYDYKELSSSMKGWIIHFTCEDNYLEHPCWQTDAQLNEGINMVHFWHDANFTTVQMGTHWKDMYGKIHKTDDLLLDV